jgi:hypothetical protein
LASTCHPLWTLFAGGRWCPAAPHKGGPPGSTPGPATACSQIPVRGSRSSPGVYAASSSALVAMPHSQAAAAASSRRSRPAMPCVGVEWPWRALRSQRTASGWSSAGNDGMVRMWEACHWSVAPRRPHYGHPGGGPDHRQDAKHRAWRPSAGAAPPAQQGRRAEHRSAEEGSFTYRTGTTTVGDRWEEFHNRPGRWPASSSWTSWDVVGEP